MISVPQTANFGFCRILANTKDDGFLSLVCCRGVVGIYFLEEREAGITSFSIIYYYLTAVVVYNWAGGEGGGEVKVIVIFWALKIIQKKLTKFTKILIYIKTLCIIFCVKMCQYFNDIFSSRNESIFFGLGNSHILVWGY